MAAILEKRDLRDFDWLTSLLAISIACFGIWQIHNALPTESYWSKQITGLCIAIVAFVVVAFTDYRRIIDAAPVFYGFGLVLLFLVLTPLGVEVNGQQAWLKLPIIGQFQPSEFVKIPTILMLAKYFGGRKSGELTIWEMLIGVAIFAGPIGLIMLEPDAGQAMTYFPILAAMLFLSGDKVRYVVLRSGRGGDIGPVRIYGRRKNGQDKTISAGEDTCDHRSGSGRSAGLRLSYHPVDHHCRQRRTVRHQGRLGNIAKRFEVFARAADRFHFCCNG